MEVSYDDREDFVRLTTSTYNDVMQYADAPHRAPEVRRSNFFYAEAIKEAADLVVEGFNSLPLETSKEKYFEPVRNLIETTEQILRSNDDAALEALGGRDIIQSMLWAYTAVSRNYI